MNVRDLDQLVRRAQTAGYPDVPTYCLELESALRWIADGESGVWGVRAREALHTSVRPTGVKTSGGDE